jgi:hypothetical protein
MLRFILCLRWFEMDLANTCCVTFLCPRLHWMCLIITFWDTFVSSLSWDGFSQHELRYILCSRWHMKGLVNTRWDAFCVLACIEWISSTHVEMYFVSWLVYEGFGQHVLWCILRLRRHGAACSIRVEIHYG